MNKQNVSMNTSANIQTPVNTYSWKGKNEKGVVTEGEMVSSNPTLVKLELRRQGIIPIRVTKKGKPLFASFKEKKIAVRDIAIFIRQLSTMLSSGIPLVQAIDIIHKGAETETMRKLLLDLRTNLESGNSLGESFKKYPKYFDDLFCNLVMAGEQSGSLDTMLQRLAAYKEKVESMKAKVKKALMYPAAVLSVALLVTAGLLVFVVPQFQAIFQGVGADLPFLTRGVIALSDFVQKYWWLGFGLIIGCIFAFRTALQRSAAFAFMVDKWMLKFPIIGTLIEKSVIARFTRTLATTFGAGMPLIEALNAVSGACGNLVYGKATLQIRQEVSTGVQLQLAMRQSNLFPHMVIQMIAVGEESGALEKMLGKVADFYEEQVDNAVEGLATLIEPLVIVILGIIIGTLVVALYMPIFKLGTAI
jgi:type IV pilus assembly protein PilC